MTATEAAQPVKVVDPFLVPFVTRQMLEPLVMELSPSERPVGSQWTISWPE